MSNFTQDMKDIMEKSETFIISTANKDGKPNGIPAGAFMISDNQILIIDYLMNKTRKNINENPVVSITAWDLLVHYGYQFKGKARVETTGEMFDKAVEIYNSKFGSGDLKLTVKSAIIVKVDEVYYVGTKNSGKNLL